MANTIRVPDGWENIARSTNHTIYEKTGMLGGEKLHVAKDIRDGKWYVQVEDTSRFFADEDWDVISVKDNKPQALQKAAMYMREN